MPPASAGGVAQPGIAARTERKKRDRNRQGRLRPAVGPLLLCGEDGAAAMAPVAAQASVHEKGREEGWRRRGRHHAAREEGTVLCV